MEVPFNPTEEPRTQRNHTDIQEIARRLRDSNSHRIIESPGRPTQRAESSPTSLLNLVKRALKIILFLIGFYYGLKIILLLIIAMENS